MKTSWGQLRAWPILNVVFYWFPHGRHWFKFATLPEWTVCSRIAQLLGAFSFPDLVALLRFSHTYCNWAIVLTSFSRLLCGHSMNLTWTWHRVNCILKFSVWLRENCWWVDGCTENHTETGIVIQMTLVQVGDKLFKSAVEPLCFELAINLKYPLFQSQTDFLFAVLPLLDFKSVTLKPHHSSFFPIVPWNHLSD